MTKTSTLTNKMWEEGRQYFDSKGSVERWMGICHGWAAAAYMYPRPAKAIYVKNSEGLEIPFFPSDIKGLGSLNYAKKRYASKFIGGRCNKKDPAKDDNMGEYDPVCFDTNPGVLAPSSCKSNCKSEKEVSLLMRPMITRFGINQYILTAIHILIRKHISMCKSFLKRHYKNCQL